MFLVCTDRFSANKTIPKQVMAEAIRHNLFFRTPAQASNTSHFPAAWGTINRCLELAGIACKHHLLTEMMPNTPQQQEKYAWELRDVFCFPFVTNHVR